MIKKIEVIKSNGATGVIIKINRTEVECLQASLSAETSLDELYIDLAKQGATSKELKKVSKATREVKTAWMLNRAVGHCPALSGSARKLGRRLSEGDAKGKRAGFAEAGFFGMVEEPGRQDVPTIFRGGSSKGSTNGGRRASNLYG